MRSKYTFRWIALGKISFSSGDSLAGLGKIRSHLDIPAFVALCLSSTPVGSHTGKTNLSPEQQWFPHFEERSHCTLAHFCSRTASYNGPASGPSRHRPEAAAAGPRAPAARGGGAPPHRRRGESATTAGGFAFLVPKRAESVLPYSTAKSISEALNHKCRCWILP